MAVWDVLKPGLKALVGGLGADPSAAGNPPMTVVWVDEPRPMTPTAIIAPGITDAIMILTISQVVGQGWDESIQNQDLNQPGGQDLQDEWRGNRKFTLTVKVEAEIQTNTGWAYEYLERVRNALFFRSTRTALHALNLAWTKVHATADLTAALDDRNRSIAALDVAMAWRVDYLDPNRYPSIATVSPLTYTGLPGSP